MTLPNRKSTDDERIPAFGYCAKSSEDYRGSIGGQRRVITRDVALAGGRDLIHIFEDESASAFLGSRGQGLADAKRAVIEAAKRYGRAELWVQHSDRIARGDGLQADHLAEVFFELRRAGVTIRSVEDDDTFADPMRVAAMGERNRADSTRKSTASRDGKRRRWDEKRKPGGAVNDGYMLEAEVDEDGSPLTLGDGRIVYRRVPDPQRRKVIERMFKLLERGHTPAEVARALNRAGMKTRKEADWKASRIREVASNGYYAGLVTCYGETVEGDHEPLIRRARWRKIVAALRRTDAVGVQMHAAGRPAVNPALLRGIGKCGRCGCTLYYEPPRRRTANSRQGNRAYYVCAAVRECRGTCDSGRVQAQVVDAQVLARLEDFVGDVEGWITERVRAHDGEREVYAAALDEQHAMLHKLERRAHRAREHHDALLDDPSAGTALVRTALEEVDRIEASCRTLADDISQATARLSEWEAPDLDSALDWFNDLRETIAGRGSGSESVEELNAALRKVLQGVWVETADDPQLGRVLVVNFLLRADDTGSTPEISLVTRVDHWQRVLDQKEPIVPSRLDPGTATVSPDNPFVQADRAARRSGCAGVSKSPPRRTSPTCVASWTSTVRR